MSASLPLILVPGLACSPRIYAPQIPALWQQGPVILANHIRDNTMAGIAKRILDEAPPRFAIAGHSMGGYIALEVIRQAPERVARLALLNSYASPAIAEFITYCRGWIADVKQGGYRGLIDRMFASAVHQSRVSDTQLKEAVRQMADEIGPDGFIGQVEAIMTRSDGRPALAAIKCPTLVVTSDTDNSVPSNLSIEIASDVANAKLVMVANCGHLSPLEQPAAVTTALLDWSKI